MAELATSIGPLTLNEPGLEAWGRAAGVAARSGHLPLPLVVALRGPLGAGKSVLARAVARGAGIDSPMPSPTYNLRFTYEAAGDPGGAAGASAGAGSDEPLSVHHLDLYRLEDPDDVWELGWRELGTGREIVLIEWPERAESLLPADRWDVTLAFLDDPGAAGLRELRIARCGSAPPPPGIEGRT